MSRRESDYQFNITYGADGVPHYRLDNNGGVAAEYELVAYFIRDYEDLSRSEQMVELADLEARIYVLPEQERKFEEPKMERISQLKKGHERFDADSMKMRLNKILQSTTPSKEEVEKFLTDVKERCSRLTGDEILIMLGETRKRLLDDEHRRHAARG